MGWWSYEVHIGLRICSEEVLIPALPRKPWEYHVVREKPLDPRTMAFALFKDREWRRETSDGKYLISTSISRLDLDWINTALDSEDMHWAKALPREQLSIMLSNSLTLGLYKVSAERSRDQRPDSPSSPRTPSPTLEAGQDELLQQVGMARFLTDYITFAYLTDVYIDKQSRSLGLGKWVIQCCQEIMQEIPALRRGMLLTSPKVGQRFYARELGFYDVGEERDYMVCMTRRAYKVDGE